jgi:hypothetical protein
VPVFNEQDSIGADLILRERPYTAGCDELIYRGHPGVVSLAQNAPNKVMRMTVIVEELHWI